MRERQDGLFRLLKKIYSGLQGYLDSDVDVEIQPIKLGFSICFRHDMDRFDERGFDEFMQFEEQFDAPATLFFLESQVSRFGERIRKVTGEKFEMALHSEAKPNSSLARGVQWTEPILRIETNDHRVVSAQRHSGPTLSRLPFFY